MVRAAQFMIYFQGIHFNTNNALYINFQKHTSSFCKEIISTIVGEGHNQCYVLPKIVCDTTNNYFKIEDRYSGLICQHALANILNVSQRFIKSLRQPTKPHGIVSQFLNK